MCVRAYQTPLGMFRATRKFWHLTLSLVFPLYWSFLVGRKFADEILFFRLGVCLQYFIWNYRYSYDVRVQISATLRFCSSNSQPHCEMLDRIARQLLRQLLCVGCICVIFITVDMMEASMTFCR